MAEQLYVVCRRYYQGALPSQCWRGSPLPIAMATRFAAMCRAEDAAGGSFLCGDTWIEPAPEDKPEAHI